MHAKISAPVLKTLGARLRALRVARLMTHAAQEMIVAACALLERDGSRDLALETLLMYAVSIR